MFTKVEMKPYLRSKHHVKTFLKLKEHGYLESWSIGTEHGRIASRFITYEGTEDTLMSEDIRDNNYSSLIYMHLGRVFELIFGNPPPYIEKEILN